MPAGEATPDWMSPGRARISTMLVCRRAAEVAAFAEQVFGATPLGTPLYRGDGTLWNLELTLDGATLMLSEAQDGFERPGFVYVQVPDTDATFAAAEAAGATAIMRPEMQFYGAYDGGVEDMGGNWWWIGTHKTTLTAAEIEAGARALEARRAGIVS